MTYHPADPQAARDPFAALAGLRDACPVSKVGGDGLDPVTLVTRYHDARSVYRDYRSFGNIGFYPSLEAYGRIPPQERSIIDIDPPEHTAVRRLCLLAMKPAAVQTVVPGLTATAHRLVGRLVDDGGGEIVSDLAAPLPADAIAAVLGLPQEDAPLVHEWVATMFSEPTEAAPRPDDSRVLHIDSAFDDYISEQIAIRKQDPDREDAIARMVRFRRDDGSPFPDRELLVHIRTLLLAGNETTTSLISNAVYRLLTVPGAEAQIRGDRDLIPAFVEECLRMDTPNTQFPRRCLQDSQIGGVDVAKDEVISISIQSANRDESVWGADAEDFRLDRFQDGQLDHLSFGLGVHFCVGAHLARTTARIALEALLDQTSDMRLAEGYEFDRVWFFQFWRPKRLDVQLTAAG